MGKLDHEKDAEVGAKKATDYPDSLQLSSNKLLENEYAKVANGQSTIEDSFLPGAGRFLAAKIKDNTQLAGDLLELLSTEPPTVPYIMTAIQKDLETGVNFGDREIHAKLTLAQMGQLKKHVGKLTSDEGFLLQYCRKLREVSDRRI